MGLFKKLFGKKDGSSNVNEQDIVDAGACPNCWGRQEYEGKFIDFVNDQTKSNINHDKEHQKAFVAQFVETHVTGIRLKNDGNKMTCPKCKGKYQMSAR